MTKNNFYVEFFLIFNSRGSSPDAFIRGGVHLMPACALSWSLDTRLCV